ncbi:MAG TPA: DUF3800 domain-containing protein [Candidatus Limiplasma sp.]|nr:DUF3800 domain-containing protein [Candidatus Limiplasma sp.]
MPKKILSIFVDESGDFGDPCDHSPFYIFTLVFHNQSECITASVTAFNERLAYDGYENHAIHTGPLIRREKDYQHMKVEERQLLFKRIYYFARKLPVKYQAFLFKKADYQEPFALAACMAKALADFVCCNQDFFNLFDTFIIYYDNGQHELNQILITVFSAIFGDVSFRNALQIDYRLSQVADLLCTLELLRKKLELNILTKSEEQFFTRKELKKTYLAGVDKLRFDDCS